jgi:hypothetical protein
MPTFTADWSSVNSGEIEDYVVLYAAGVATDDGEWFSCRGVDSLGILTTGITTGTVRMSGSNDATVPADTADGFTINDQTADGFATYEQHELPRWVKIHLQAWTTGTFIVTINRRYHGSTS